MAITITSVLPDSPAEKAGIKAGESLLSINGNTIRDSLDFGFYCYENELLLGLDTRQVLVKKDDDYDDIGLEFETYLMDEKKSCTNKCIFCFIDQLPPNMRETLYFKDDDSRLSFLQGNYITLTNLSDEDIDRIIKMKLNVNISVHTTNPELRCKMLNNRFAGKSLDYMKRLAENGISMNCQIVLCRGYNDGEELKRTLSDLTEMYPAVKSIAVVPFGATKYRDSLPKIELFDEQSAREAIETIDSFGIHMLKTHGERVVYPADEFFLTAGIGIPHSIYYESFDQYENGVGMCAYVWDGFLDEMEYVGEEEILPHEISVATGVLAKPLAEAMAQEFMDRFPMVRINVYAIRNEFFGETVTVSGLVTGGDLIKQLAPIKDSLGSALIIPRSMLKADEPIFLDNVTVFDVEEALGVELVPVSDEADDIIAAFIGNFEAE